MNKYITAVINRLTDVDLKTNYKLMRKLRRIYRKPFIKLYETRDFYISSGTQNIPVRIFSPSKANPPELFKSVYPIIIFFHGGGWTYGDLDDYEKTCLTIAKQTSCIVAAVGYRLAPEHTFPAAFEDCYNAVKHITEQNKISENPRDIIIMGDSAGANLAAAVSLYMRDNGEEIPSKQILIYPPTYNDHTESSPFPSVTINGYDYVLKLRHINAFKDMYCTQEEDRKSPYFAPLLTEDFSNQPKTLIITTEYDPLRDEGEEYGRKLKEADNSVTVHRIADTCHGYFVLSARYSVIKETYKIINNFLNQSIQ